MDVRSIHRLPPIGALTRDQTCNLDMCPAQGSNQQRFWCVGQPTEPPGQVQNGTFSTIRGVIREGEGLDR